MGGLVAAEKLAKLSFDVTVYEQASSPETMRYDWHDDVNPSVFRRLGIEMPEGSFKKKSWTFVSPHGAVVREFRQDEATADWSVERRPLNKILVDRAVAAGASVVFGARVERAIVEKSTVVGVIVDGREERADLVVDSLGVSSPVRKDLPVEFGVTQYRETRSSSPTAPFIARIPTRPRPSTPTKSTSNTWVRRAFRGSYRITIPSSSTCSWAG